MEKRVTVAHGTARVGRRAVHVIVTVRVSTRVSPATNLRAGQRRVRLVRVLTKHPAEKVAVNKTRRQSNCP